MMRMRCAAIRCYGGLVDLGPRPWRRLPRLGPACRFGWCRLPARDPLDPPLAGFWM